MSTGTRVIQEWEIDTGDTQFIIPSRCPDNIPMSDEKFGDCWEIVNHALNNSPVEFDPRDILTVKVVKQVTL